MKVNNLEYSFGDFETLEEPEKGHYIGMIKDIRKFKRRIKYLEMKISMMQVLVDQKNEDLKSKPSLSGI
jgi:hypothetical protein